MIQSLKVLALTLVAVFAPTKQVLLSTLALILADLLFGLLAAKQQGQPITSSGLKRTVIKLFVYNSAILLSFLVGEYLVPMDLPIMKTVTGLIGVTELKSVLENLDIIHGGSFFKAIVTKLQIMGSDDENDDKDS